MIAGLTGFATFSFSIGSTRAPSDYSVRIYEHVNKPVATINLDSTSSTYLFLCDHTLSSTTIPVTGTFTSSSFEAYLKLWDDAMIDHWKVRPFVTILVDLFPVIGSASMTAVVPCPYLRHASSYRSERQCHLLDIREKFQIHSAKICWVPVER
jgi:hypothetical protein